MELSNFFEKNNKVAIAFSGGVDSAYLLYAAKKNNADVIAYYVKSDFQPEFELEDAIKVADKIDAKLEIINVDILQYEEVTKNPEDRCYYCKQKIFGTIVERAKKDGYSVVLDGTNASDSYDDRPGMKAKEEMKVLSPLRECNLTKDDIRNLSKEARLFTWNKPSYSCLATRIKTGAKITKQKLISTENAEKFLMNLGFSDFRVRNIDRIAKIQVKEKDLIKLIEYRAEILQEFRKYYEEVVLDLELR